jgi:cytochrome c-type biogenesis protein
MQPDVSWILALGAGVLSFFSPCILPLLPAYLSFITGRAVEDILENRPARRELFPHVLLFCMGFSVVFVAMGATASTLGQVLFRHQRIMEWVGGLLIVFLGLHQLGLFQWRFLQVEKGLHLRARPTHALGAFIVGVAFAVGWTPCIGPILGSILTYAGTRDTLSQGVFLLAVFSMGLALPFLALGLGLGTVLPRLRAARRLMRGVTMASGGLLIIMGLLLITDNMKFLYRLVL